MFKNTVVLCLSLVEFDEIYFRKYAARMKIHDLQNFA